MSFHQCSTFIFIFVLFIRTSGQTLGTIKAISSCRYLEAMNIKVLLYWLVRASEDYSVLITQSSGPNPFGGAFTKLHRATVSFVMSVWPSIRMEQHGSHGTDFHEIWYLNIFQKSLEKVEISLKSDKNNSYFTWRPVYMSDHMSLSS